MTKKTSAKKTTTKKTSTSSRAKYKRTKAAKPVTKAQIARAKKAYKSISECYVNASNAQMIAERTGNEIAGKVRLAEGLIGRIENSESSASTKGNLKVLADNVKASRALLKKAAIRSKRSWS
jgi:hypothetical protein